MSDIGVRSRGPQPCEVARFAVLFWKTPVYVDGDDQTREPKNSAEEDDNKT